jgi:hypothetical protein
VRFRAYRVVAFCLVAAFSAAQDSPGKSSESERIFSQPAAAVQAVLQKLPGGTSGRLPVLDGFVVPGAQPLSSYQRPYYQCEVKVAAAKSGGSRVRATAKITAWFSSPGHSGYETLESNGRVEADLLDRLQDALAATSGNTTALAIKADSSHPAAKSKAPATVAPEISAPMPRLPDQHSGLRVPPPKEQNNPPDASQSGPQSGLQNKDVQNKDLQQEAKNLEDILRNQSHPTNLVAVRKGGTPVLQNPIVDAKVLFLASAEDEFEVLEETPGWVHVRISGLSRGWLRRSEVEMPGDSPALADDAAAAAQTSKAAAADAAPAVALFSISSEEIGSFPGEWPPLSGKNVKIISLQQAPGTGRITSPQEKKQFAAALFQKESPGLSSGAAGMVLMFDAEDGGMVAATTSLLEQWKRGAISEQEFWKHCFLDPPEILGDTN